MNLKKKKKSELKKTHTKKPQAQIYRADWPLPRGGLCGLGEVSEADLRYKLPVIKEISYGDIIYSMVTTVKHSVWYI